MAFDREAAHLLSYKLGAYAGFALGGAVFSTVLFTILYLRGRMVWSTYPAYVSIVALCAMLLYAIISNVGTRKVPAEEF